MRTLKKMLAICLALTLVFGLAAAETAIAPETVVLSVGEKEFTAQNLDSMAYMLYTQSVVQKYPDYETAMDYLIQQAVLQDYLVSKGYTEFTEEEKAAFRNEAQASWDGYLDNYVRYYQTENTDEERARLRAQAEEDYTSQGATLDTLIDNLEFDAAVERMESDLTGGYEPSEEEITNMFEELGALYLAQFENNVSAYEMYTRQTGYESLYVPEGYRAVLHILLEVDDGLLSAYTEAQAALEEAESAETVDEAAVTEAKAAAGKAFDAVIASRQDVIDEIYARLEKGESFQDLIAEYGTDPGMKQESYLKEGYKVHAESVIYDAAFTAGAFQEKMQKPGDVSDPVVGRFGIHILYYLDDVPGGLIMTDSIHNEIAQVLSSQKLNEAYDAAYQEWEKTLTIVRNEELVAQMAAEAEKQLQESQKTE